MEIQWKVIKQTKRNAVSRLLHAKNDKEMITGWKAELNRILQLFTVCSAVFTRPSLTVLFQAELVVNIHVNVSGIRSDVSKILEGAGGQVQSVSARCIQPVDNRRVLTVSQTQTRSAASTANASSTLYLHIAHLESHLPRRRGPVSGATS
jgi:hypothetical protein